VVCLLSWAATKIAMKKLPSLSYRDAYAHGLLPNMSASALGAWQLLPARTPAASAFLIPLSPSHHGDPHSETTTGIHAPEAVSLPSLRMFTYFRKNLPIDLVPAESDDLHSNGEGRIVGAFFLRT